MMASAEAKDFCLTESQTDKTPEDHLIEILSRLKDRVDRPDPAAPFSILTGDRSFNEAFYAGVYGRLCGAIEDIRRMKGHGMTLKELAEHWR